MVFSDIVATDQIEALSDDAGDTTQILTVYGRSAAGQLLVEGKTLTGASPVTFTNTFARILKMVLSGAATGTVTLRDQDTDTTIAAMEPGLLQIRRIFYNAAAEGSGGSDLDYYEKVFYKNTHASLTLLNASIIEQADPTRNNFV